MWNTQSMFIVVYGGEQWRDLLLEFPKEQSEGGKSASLLVLFSEWQPLRINKYRKETVSISRKNKSDRIMIELIMHGRRSVNTLSWIWRQKTRWQARYSFFNIIGSVVAECQSSRLHEFQEYRENDVSGKSVSCLNVNNGE